jgi:hypothetical protein
MNDVVSIGSPPWSRSEMLDCLAEFADLYAKRPIQDNLGGMKSPHMFMSWFAMKKLQPRYIVESGVWRGQGTWLFEQACPEAELHCIEITPGHIRYRSSRARYYNHDFTTIDWSHLSADKTVLFFDDHQNAFERTKAVRTLGFKHLLFEDNYPANYGDVYSLKMVFAHSGFAPKPSAPLVPTTFKGKLKQIATSALATLSPAFKTTTYVPPVTVPPNQVDDEILRQNLEVYYEFPPVFLPKQTRWNDTWDEKYPTPAPLLTSVTQSYQQVYLDEAKEYTWICYAKLKQGNQLD